MNSWVSCPSTFLAGFQTHDPNECRALTVFWFYDILLHLCCPADSLISTFLTVHRPIRLDVCWIDVVHVLICRWSKELMDVFSEYLATFEGSAAQDRINILRVSSFTE